MGKHIGAHVRQSATPHPHKAEGLETPQHPKPFRLPSGAKNAAE